MKISRSNNRAYTLIEALVASSVLLIGISAASSMSLALVTQEEINERANRSFNYIDNAVRLIQLGVDPQVVQDSILPTCKEIAGLTVEEQAVVIPNLGNRTKVWIKFAYTTTDSDKTWVSNFMDDTWTGGESTAARKEGFYVYKSEHFLTKELARVQYYKASATP